MPAPSNSLTHLLTRYVEAMSSVEGKSKTTIKSYQNRLRIFVRWAGDGATLDAVTESTLYDFLDYLNARKTDDGRPICKTTVNTFFNALRAFGAWLVVRRYWQENIVAAVKIPDRSEPDRRYVEDQTVTDLLSACNKIYPLRRSLMATLVIRLLCYSGIRRSELLNMHLDHINIRANEITIHHGKGDKTRVLGLHPEIRSAYLAWRTARGECHNPNLLTVDRNRRLGDEGLRALLREIESVAGHRGERITCHPLRSNYATYAHYQAQMPSQAVQITMGHSRLATTEQYFRKRPKAAIDGMKAMPIREAARPERIDLRRVRQGRS